MSKRISQLPSLTRPQADDLIPFSHAGETKSVKFSALNGGQFYNVMAYGGAAGGVVDNVPAINAIIAAINADGGVGTINFPAGVFRISQGIALGVGKSLRGVDKRSTKIVVDLTVPCAIQLGEAALNSWYLGNISNLNISRATGAVGANTIGIDARYLSYTSIDDVRIDRQGVAIKTNSTDWDSNGALGLYLNRVHIYNCIIHLWLRDIAQVEIFQCDFGVNGTETIAPTNLIIIEGSTNDVRIKTTQFVPRISPNDTVVFKFINITSHNPGYYTFDDINTEGVATIFQSDETCERIFELTVVDSRLTATDKLFDFDPATSVGALAFDDNTCSFNILSTIGPVEKSSFTSNYVSGGLDFQGGDLVCVGNTFTTNVTFSGAWNPLIVGLNEVVYNGVFDIQLQITGTGKITSIGNTKDAGTQPETVLPGFLKLPGGVGFDLKRYTGTLDGSGEVAFAHGIGSGQLKVLVSRAYYRGPSGEMKAMSLDAIDGVDVYLTGGTAGAHYRVTLIYANSVDSNW
jgi:hypothetical protein